MTAEHRHQAKRRRVDDSTSEDACLEGREMEDTSDGGSPGCAHHQSGSETYLAHSALDGPGSENMQIPPCMQIDSDTFHLLNSAMSAPPVTKETLTELDLGWIMNNINLRIDVNYDHDLHFMPVTGEKAEEKRRNAERYWCALATEFRIYLHNVKNCQQCSRREKSGHSEFPLRLPEMFRTLRVLLETLVPDRDHPQVAEHLDVDFLMQQVSHGVFDATKMSQWLATLLTNHCAPMRDEWAEEMAQMIEEGASDPSMIQLVGGLEKLFSFLEAMKLDVANHQIRTLKWLLIDDTIPYQQGYFRERIDDGQLDVQSIRGWYKQACESFLSTAGKTECSPTHQPFVTFVHGLADLCNPERSFQELIKAIPASLHYDRARLCRLYSEIDDLVYTQLSIQVFDSLISDFSHASPIHPGLYQHLSGRLWIITDSEVEEDVSKLWNENIDAVALEITAFAQKLQRRSSCTLNEHFVAVRRQLQVAYSQQHTSESRKLLRDLERAIIQHAEKFGRMTPKEMSTKQVEWQTNCQHIFQSRYVPELEDIARRMAHMSVLHWQVWKDMAYLPAFEEIAPGVGALAGDEDTSGFESTFPYDWHMDEDIDNGQTRETEALPCMGLEETEKGGRVCNSSNNNNHT